MYRQNYFSKRNHKFNAKGTVYNGRKYDSKLEANYAMNLDWRIKAGEIKEVIPQYKISLDVNGMHICNYYVDFKLIMSDDSIQLHECKGFITEIFRLKRLLMEAIYLKENPGVEYFIIT